MKINGHIDSHNHLAKVLHTHPDRINVWIQDALDSGIGFFMQGGIDPQNWQHQIQLQERLPGQIGLCFGIHPYFASERSITELDPILDQLAQCIGQHSGNSELLAIGELGLDFRPDYVKNGTESQIHALEIQIELADWTGLPMVFHIVQAHLECERIFSLWNPKNKRGLMHSFSGSLEQAEYWMQHGLLISLGGPVCHEKNKKARRLATHIPLEFLTLETDSPDQPPPEYARGENPPKTLWQVAKTIGELRNLDAEEILDISNSNFLRVFRKDRKNV
ncbi:MAG: TatD family hydrolase [Bdellovibrionaceae bacterium]|nr:TatD family hydrolase [Pseudobdellovibrionaceae bacterium]